jgi:hypothetical protein
MSFRPAELLQRAVVTVVRSAGGVLLPAVGSTLRNPDPAKIYSWCNA